MSSDDCFLAAADSIGRRIVADAIWHEGRCSWMGAVVKREQPWRAEYRALEPHLYDGTAGCRVCSWPQLAAVTGEADRTPHCASEPCATLVARAPSAVAGESRRVPRGLARRRLGRRPRRGALVRRGALHASARAVPDVAPSGRSRSTSLTSSSAVPARSLALLALADAFDDPASRSRRAGDRRGADRPSAIRHPPRLVLGDPWSTATRTIFAGSRMAPLVSGWALLELFAATGDERFRVGASERFAYERSWLDVGSGTWPDLRVSAASVAAGRDRVGSPQAGRHVVPRRRRHRADAVARDRRAAVRRRSCRTRRSRSRRLGGTWPERCAMRSRT